MPKLELPIANGFYVSDSLPISAQECTNWYPNITQGVGLSPETLFGTDGLTQVATSGTLNNTNRGAHEMAGKPYFVNGGKLYRLDKSGDDYSLVIIGTISGTARVSMADNLLLYTSPSPRDRTRSLILYCKLKKQTIIHILHPTIHP